MRVLLTLAFKMPGTGIVLPSRAFPFRQTRRLSFPPEADLSEPLLHRFTGADTLKADGPQTARTEGPQNCGFTTEPERLQTVPGVNPHQLKPNALRIWSVVGSFPLQALGALKGNESAAFLPLSLPFVLNTKTSQDL